MRDFWINVAGWIPAITLPLATLFQLRQLLKTKSAEGVFLNFVIVGVIITYRRRKTQ